MISPVLAAGGQGVASTPATRALVAAIASTRRQNFLTQRRIFAIWVFNYGYACRFRFSASYQDKADARCRIGRESPARPLDYNLRGRIRELEIGQPVAVDQGDGQADGLQHTGMLGDAPAGDVKGGAVVY